MNEDKFLWRLFIHWLKTYQLGTYYVPAAVLGALLPVLMGATDNEAGEDIHVGWPEGKGSYPAPPQRGDMGKYQGRLPGGSNLEAETWRTRDGQARS